MAFVYDPLKNEINFSKRKATDYKLNKSVILPDPLDSIEELQCELRRVAYMEAWKKYQETIKDMNENTKAKKESKRRKKKTRILGACERNSSRINTRDPINLKEKKGSVVEKEKK